MSAPFNRLRGVSNTEETISQNKKLNKYIFIDTLR